MKTKILLLFLAVALAQPVIAQERASAIMQEAQKQAVKQDKNILIMFHASWCGWCKRMDKKMSEASTKAYFDNHFVTKHITVLESEDHKDLENPGGMKFLTKYDGAEAGLPFWLIFDQDGNLLTNSFDADGANLGCPASEDEVAEFVKKLKATTDITENQQQAVTEAFILKN